MHVVQSIPRLFFLNGIHQFQHILTGSRTQDGVRIFQGDLLPGGGHLIQQGDGIPETACRLACDQDQGILIRRDLFLFGYFFKLQGDGINRGAFEFMALAA